MPSKRVVPAALLHRPVTLDDARRHGLELWHLQGESWRRVAPATYLHSSLKDNASLKLESAGYRLPIGAAFSGRTAAWLHGLGPDFCEPIEVTVPAGKQVSSRVGMKLRRCELAEGDVVRVRALPVTSVFRTLLDLSIRSALVEVVVMVDTALHARHITLQSLRAAIGSSAGKQGVEMLRRAADHAEPKTESPMETRLRMLLVLAGLPRPEAQVSIRDRFFKLRGRVDLYYPDHKLALEYDGATHKDSIAEDNRRQNRLVDAGIRLLRFTAQDIYATPDIVVSQVRRALAS